MKSLSQKDVERFWGRVNTGISNIFYQGERCWEWSAGKEGDGYGAFCVEGKQYKAHRIAWTITNGEIPEGLSVLHHCDNPSCVHPHHLFIGTQRENMRDKILKGRRGNTSPISPSRRVSRKPSRELTYSDRDEIRRRYEAGESSYKIAKDKGICQSRAYRIATQNR